MSNTNDFEINYTTVLNPNTIKKLLESKESDNFSWKSEIDRAISENKEDELYLSLIHI